ncbi:MAG TPA: ComF family protein [Anaerolineales bacterium]|nr:ComF family protein [Anaerolineales bacterium]
MSNKLKAKQSSYRAYCKLWEILDWIYPPHCGGCGETGSRWCQNCRSQVKLVDKNYCPTCGHVHHSPGLCSRCASHIPSFHSMRSWAFFDGPVRNALHRLKYQGDIALGEVLARPMLQLLQNLQWEIDCILPVPLAIDRQRKRGYNQAALLAYPLALGAGIFYGAKGLVKIKETQTQVGLTFEQRHENVEGAFRAYSKIVKNRKVLVVDDVTTSGATIESCASAIMEAGADRVYGMTLAQAPYHS